MSAHREKTKVVEWPPGSRRTASYTHLELVDMTRLILQAHAAGVPVGKLGTDEPGTILNQVTLIHNLKAEFAAEAIWEDWPTA